MAAQVFAAVIGALAGGIGAGVRSYKNNKILADANSNYAKEVRNAAQQYSGRNADTAVRKAGSNEALYQNNRFMPSNKGIVSNMSIQNALRNNPIDYSQQGQSTGKSVKANELNAKYNAATAKAQQAMNQAGINYQVANQQGQTIANSAAGLADMYKTIKSDEKAKEPYHNKEGIPEADAADALRQIESVEYKYKPETGLDQDKHVGTIAQSYKGTAFEDVVQTDIDDYESLDKDKLLESVMAGIAALQKELDEAEAKKHN